MVVKIPLARSKDCNEQPDAPQNGGDMARPKIALLFSFLIKINRNRRSRFCKNLVGFVILPTEIIM
jgi:hypothetical protein